MSNLEDIVNFEYCNLSDNLFRQRCKDTLDQKGVLVLDNFLYPSAIQRIIQQGEENQHLAYFCQQSHSVYLTPFDSKFPAEHPQNYQVASSKGCITDDQISENSPLRTVYDAEGFHSFLCYVLGEESLHKYADPLSSINLHYAREGEELGWHFDNSSFAITLLVQKPEAGGVFEYVKDARNSSKGDMNYSLVDSVLAGKIKGTALSMEPGALVLFRGRDSLHRVTPTKGDSTRMLVVLAYNSQPGIALSEFAQETFYGRSVKPPLEEVSYGVEQT
ncbi:2OG-Fe(II) oxygenase [Neptunomonas sp.]|uniref:HalD/BesD family halogenase n=1 Tax=Neptunomonas sp. TaxID=1971898 RepID=UPI0025FDE8B1|nr:2OG-Fe(II) oxygenase [Neptunomonas sp.]